MKQKCRFHDHFSKFLVSAIYEFETRTATRSAWQVIRQYVFMRTCSSFVNFWTFSIIFSPPTLYCLTASISVRNYPTNCTLRSKSLFPFVPCSTFQLSLCFPLRQTFSFYVIRFVRTCDYVCHTFKSASFLHISSSKSADFSIFLVGLTDWKFYILNTLQNVTNYFLYLWKMCEIHPTRRDLTKFHKCHRCACVHTKTVTFCAKDMVQLWASCHKVMWLNACEECGLEHESLHWLRLVYCLNSGICGV